MDEIESADTGQPPTAVMPTYQMPEFDPRTGDHFWIVTVNYRVDPRQLTDPSAQVFLDAENIVFTLPPGCWHCELPYTPQLAKRRCRGHGGS